MGMHQVTYEITALWGLFTSNLTYFNPAILTRKPGCSSGVTVRNRGIPKMAILVRKWCSFQKPYILKKSKKNVSKIQEIPETARKLEESRGIPRDLIWFCHLVHLAPCVFSGKNRLFCKRAVFTQIQFFISWWCRTVRRKSRNVRRAKDLRMEAGTYLGNAKLERLKFKNGKRLMLAIKNGDFTISNENIMM